jgi:hypothetical protein
MIVRAGRPGDFRVSSVGCLGGSFGFSSPRASDADRVNIRFGSLADKQPGPKCGFAHLGPVADKDRRAGNFTGNFAKSRLWQRQRLQVMRSLQGFQIPYSTKQDYFRGTRTIAK